MDTDTELTELVAIDPRRLDGVRSPASGMPFLIMKSTAAKDVDKKGNVNEAPDVSAAEEVLRQLARLIQSEARELEAGHWDEICDIALLTDAARCIKYFRCAEMAADESIMKSLESAIERRSAELGVSNPMTDAASKDADITPTDPTPVAPTTDAPVEKSTADLIAEAIAKSKAESDEALSKAMQERDETIKGLRAEMAEKLNQPMPGGPFITNSPLTKAAAHATDKGEIERFERLAKDTEDRELSRYYADRARELKGSQN